MMIRPANITRADDFFFLLPAGAGFDIPTGRLMKGRRGENIIMGGVGPLMGIVGRPNRFKSTIMHYLTMSVMSRLMEAIDTATMTFDSEVNLSMMRLRDLAHRFKNLIEQGVFDDNGAWILSNSITTTADEWYEEFRKYLTFKIDNKKSLMVETPFFEKDMSSVMKILAITLGQIDSLTGFTTSDVLDMQADAKLGESGGNMIHARQGLIKTRLMMEAPTLAGRANNYMFYTAHLNDVVQLAAGPYAPQPSKQLEGMKANEKIKGVSSQFLYLMTVVWETVKSSNLLMSDTRKVRYPDGPDDDIIGDPDLKEVWCNTLRSKVGPTSIQIPVVVSQSKGVDPNLTNFNYIDQHQKKFGIGNPTARQGSYMELYPEGTFSRTTIRSKMEEDPRLRRAVEITAELAQMREFWYHKVGRIPDPKTIYDTLKAKGYDMNQLLDTRGYYTLNQYEHPIPFLSTWDLVEMVEGRYHPYWLP